MDAVLDGSVRRSLLQIAFIPKRKPLPHRPRGGTQNLPLAQAVGKYLERPYLNYPVGRRMTKQMIQSFVDYGIKTLEVHDEKPPRRQCVSTPIKDTCLLLDNDDVDVLVVADKPLSRPQPSEVGGASRRVETLATIQSAFIDDHGVPRVGGVYAKHHRSIDFAAFPVQPCQKAVEAEYVASSGDLTNPWNRSGVLRLTRVANQVDICIGLLPGSVDLPAIAYRLDLEDLVGDDPAVILSSDVKVPENGQYVEGGEILPKGKIGEVRRSFTMLRAVLDEHQKPALTSRTGRSLSAFQTNYFRPLQEMVELQNDMTVPMDDEFDPPPLVDPGSFMWKPMLEVSIDLAHALTEGEEIEGFKATPKLISDLVAGLGLKGDFGLHAEHSGVVKSIAPYAGSDDLVQITIDDETQLCPACVCLLKQVEAEPTGEDDVNQVRYVTRALEVGDNLDRGEWIGDWLPRRRYNLEQIVEHAGGHVSVIIGDFLAQSAVWPGQDGWAGPDVLFDLRYMSSLLTSSSAKDYFTANSAGEIKLFWDLRSADDLVTLDGEVILPPIRYTDWDNCLLSLGGVDFHFGEPNDAPPGYHWPGKPYNRSRNGSKKKKKNPKRVSSQTESSAASETPS